MFTSYLKKGRKFSDLDTAPVMQKTNRVQVAKKKDVQKLMAFFEEPHETHAFYEDVPAAADSKGPDIEPDTYDDRETFL